MFGQGDQRDDIICTLGVTKLKEKFQIIEQRLQRDTQKDVLRKILLSLTSHEQQQSQTYTLSNSSIDDMSCISIPCVQTDDFTVDTANAFE